MKKLFKVLFATLSLSLVALFTVFARANGQDIKDKIDVSLVQQENAANNKIRYVATIENVDNLNEIVDIEIHFTLSKSGEATRENHLTTTKVYTSVAGTNGFAQKDMTYYAVRVITGLDAYKGYTLGAYFKFNYSDNTYESTNSIEYTIPENYSVVSYGSGEFESSSSVADMFTASSIEGGNIFHAWNWSMSTIEANLDDIKAAGFTTVQTSPMQPQKDYWEGNAQSDWWKFYQPLGFVVAPDTCNNALGTKSDLVSMVSAAHAKGIKVIVDVVANHLAGDNTTLYGGGNGFDGVQKYEPEIYGTNGTRAGGAMLHEAGSNNIAASDDSHTTDGHIYIPDLDTGNSHVQQRVLSLLKEYIDCGVDGFRFDATKHIETDNSSEPNGASQFWPTVINGATEYAQNKGREKPYYYGEILFGCGNGRSYSWYTKYMDVIDNTTGNNVTSSFNSNTATSNSAYNTGCTANQVVVWAESHDTYANESHDSTFINQSIIDKSYAYSAARGNLQMLYLARPCADGQFGYVGTDGKLKITCQVLLGNKGDWNAFKSAQITAVNKFHNYWGNDAEWISAENNVSMIARYNENESGMVLVNAGSGTSISNLTVPTPMKDGSYEDIVTGNTFTISSGKVSGTMSSCGIAVLVSTTGGVGDTSITSTAPTTFYSDTMTATYTIKNAESATMTIDGDTFSITSGASITFGATMAVGDTKTVSITAGSKTETFTYTKIEAPQTYKVYFEKPAGWTNLYAHAWGGTATATEWPGNEITIEDGKYFFEFEEGSYDYVVFNNGTDKTEDIALTNENLVYSLDDDTSVVYFVNNQNWSTVNAYMWLSETVHNAEWPGATLSLDSTSGYYKTSFGSYTKVIFNNGTNQTVDINLDTTAGAAVYKVGTDTDGEGHYNVDVALKVKAGAACEHVYSSPVWTWNEYSSATAKFTCTECGTQKTVNATITSVITTPATENTTGIKTYTATVTFEGHNYTDTKEETIPTLDTITTVPAVAATCGTDGNILYYIRGGKYYSDSNCENEITLQDTVIPATGNHTIAPGVYSLADGATCSVCHETVTPTVSTQTIYYLVDSSWGDNWNTKANIYYWNEGTSAPNGWPGALMTKAGAVSYKGVTYSVYSYTFTSGSLSDYELVIFNSKTDGVDGGAQTNNLDVHSGNCYLNNWDDNYEATGFIYIPEGN